MTLQISIPLGILAHVSALRHQRDNSGPENQVWNTWGRWKHTEAGLTLRLIQQTTLSLPLNWSPLTRLFILGWNESPKHKVPQYQDSISRSLPAAELHLWHKLIFQSIWDSKMPRFIRSCLWRPFANHWMARLHCPLREPAETFRHSLCVPFSLQMRIAAHY